METNNRFAKELNLDYPILSDPEKGVARAYGTVTASRSFPHRWTFYIDHKGKIMEIDKKVNAGEDGATVAKKLEELGVPTR